MARIAGNAAITWTDDSSGLRVLQLDAPLRALRLGHSLATYTRESLDRSKVEYFTVSSGAYEMVGVVRYSRAGATLVDMLKAGSQGRTLTYYPNLTDSDTKAAVQLLGPVGDAGLELDADLGVRGEHQVEIRFRTTGGAMFTQPFWKDTNTLFSYRAGDSLKAATFTRVTSTGASASYPTIGAGGGYGTLTTAKSNQARLAWFSTVSSAGPRDTPALLLEGSRKNLIKYSEDFKAANWASIYTPVRTSEQTDPKGGTAAWLIGDDSTSVSTREGIKSTGFTPSSASLAVSIFMKADTSTSSQVYLARSSDSALSGEVQTDWSSGVPVNVTYANASSVAPPERWRNGWYRFQFYTTSLSNASTYELRFRPAEEPNSTGSVYFYGAQVEE